MCADVIFCLFGVHEENGNTFSLNIWEYCVWVFSNPLPYQKLSSQDKDYVMCLFDPSKYIIQVW